jgi:hypothetical protein
MEVGEICEVVAEESVVEAVGWDVDVAVSYLIPRRDSSEVIYKTVIGCAHIIMEPVICTWWSGFAPLA